MCPSRSGCRAATTASVSGTPVLLSVTVISVANEGEKLFASVAPIIAEARERGRSSFY